MPPPAAIPRPGAFPLPGGGARFHVWAPLWRRVEVDLSEGPGAGARLRLERRHDGWHSGEGADAGPGTLYRYRLDGRDAVPDPASRFQPRGPHGPSEIVDPAAYAWSDAGWAGPGRRGHVIYEMHVGTFTERGTWDAAGQRLAELADVGVTLVEIMPVAEFAGRWGWGYDGVALFAPFHGYGRPEAMRAFVDRAHALGLGVLLDVVYNHLGPDGNYLPRLTDRFLSTEHQTAWGEGINFDGPGSEHVRAFCRANVRHWIEEYHLDGLRVDATQDVHDASDPHILAELTDEARRAAGASGRSVFLVAENEPQDVRLLRTRAEGGYGFDAVWTDDVHHTAIVALTGRGGAYYSDYGGSAQELVSAAKHGFLFQGQRYEWQRKRRGTPTRGFPPRALVAYLENHDQLANSERGERVRLLSDPGRYRAMTAYLLLGPWTPMLFQGQEFGASTPFLFFADHEPELAESVRRGRAEFLKQFPHLALPEVQAALADPCDPATFERCRLRDDEREAEGPWRALHRDLLRLRREDAAFAEQRSGMLDGAVLAPECFLLRFLTDDPDEERLLLVNLERDLELKPAPEPLLAPPPEREWSLAWSSEDPRYGGRGTPEPETSEGWRIQGPMAAVLRPRLRSPIVAATSEEAP